MKRLGPAALIVFAVLLAAAALARTQDAPDPLYVNWESHRAAQERSRREGKPLLMHFTAPWSKWCDKMRRETYGDRKVRAYLNEHFAMTMIDTEKLPAMARKYQVEGLPTLWFLDAEGQRLTHLDGFVSPENLLPLLEFIVTEAYKTFDYETWRERRR